MGGVEALYYTMFNIKYSMDMIERQGGGDGGAAQVMSRQ